MAKITLLGSNSGRNAGDAAILAAIMGALTKTIDEPVEFEVPTTHPKFVESNYGKMFNVKAVDIMPWTGSIRFIGIPTFRSVKRTDVTMITDGIIFDINLWNPLFNFLITLIFIAPWCKLWGKKLVCYNVGIGPLNSFWGRVFARYVGNACDLIMVRDEDSKKLFREIGVKKEIHLTADSVFLNWAAEDSVIDSIISSLGLTEADKEGRLFGVNVTRYIDRWLKSNEKVSSKEAFLPTLAEPIVRLKIEKNIEPVVVITQVMDADYGRALMSEMKRQFKAQTGKDWEPQMVSNEVYSNHEVLGFSRRCQLYIGMRLHSLIIAARAGAPIMGLIYAPKVKSFLKQLKTPERSFELAELDANRLFNELADAWEARASIQSTQQEVVAGLERDCQHAADLVAERYYTKKSPALRESHTSAAAVGQ